MSGAHPRSHERHQAHGDMTTRAALASVSAATFLLLLKGYAAWATDSVAMLGSLADTGLDLLASLVTLYGVRLAAQPADREHRFGHGKATANAEYGIGVSLIAIVVTLGLTSYQRRVVARTGSVAIETDHVHYQSDLLLNLSVIAALALDQYVGISGADPVLGLAIAVWLAWGALKASSRAIDQLMDKEWPEEKRRRFVEVAARHPELKGIHDLRTRTSGAHDFVQFHVWMDPKMTIEEAHRVMDEVEHKLEAEFPGCEILIHIDPEGQVDQPGNALAETASSRWTPLPTVPSPAIPRR